MRLPTICALLLVCLTTLPALAAEGVDKAHLVQPEELVKMLQSKGEKPLVLMVGFDTMYAQAHIPGAEFIGPSMEPYGMARLRERAKSLPKNRSIVLYCGCCPWTHCPNIDPAFKTLRDLGFTKVKVLYIANDFGQDWMNKGYPVEKGRTAR